MSFLKRLFIRKSVLDLKNNKDLWKKVNCACFEVFIFNYGSEINEPLKIGDDELVEIDIRLKNDIRKV